MIRTGGLDDYEDQEDYQPVIGGYCPVEVDGAPCNGDLYVHVQNGRVVCEDGHQVGNKAERSVVEVPFPKTAMPVDRNFLDGLEYNYSLPVWKVHTLTAAPAGNFLNPIGAIEWRDDNKEVSQVYVAPEHRHKGVASELWHRAKKIEPDLKHSWEMTPAGRDWVTSLGPEDAGKYREDWAGMGPYNHEEHEAVWKNYNWDLPNRSAFEGILKKRTEEGEELGPFYKHIAEDGQFFRELSPHERPPGEKGYCHYNVGRAIKEGLPKGWKAAAGWAGGGSGHVWLLDEEDRVVDPTLRNITMPNHFGVIVDNPERFLRQDEEHWVFDPGEFDSEQHHASTYYHAIHNDALPIALRHGLRGGADAKDDPEGIGYTYLFDDLDVARGWGSEDDYTVLEVDPPGEVEQDPYMGEGVAKRFRGDIPPDRIRVAQVKQKRVYHGTTIPPDIILKEGILPNQWGEVYLTSTDEFEYGHHQYEVDLSKLEDEKLEPQIDWIHDHLAEQALPQVRKDLPDKDDEWHWEEARIRGQNKYEEMTESERDVIHKDPTARARSWGERGYLTYRGVIPPDAIVRHTQKTAQVQRYCVKCKKQFDESEAGSYAGFCGNCREKEGLVDHAWWSEDAQAGHYGAVEDEEDEPPIRIEMGHYASVGRYSSETRKKLLERAQGLPADQSEVVHRFDDDWTIRKLKTWGDMHREGQLMDNCWGAVKPYDDLLEDYEAGYHYSLRDPDNLPRASFYHQTPGDQDVEPPFDVETPSGDYPEGGFGSTWAALGKHNAHPHAGYIERLREWHGTLPYQVAVQPGHFNRHGAKGPKAFMAIGIPGSGKSTMLKPYADKVGATYVSSDETRGEVTGDPGDVSRDAEVWPLIYQRVHDALDQGDVVVDATFSNGEKRRDMVRHLRLKADEVHGIWFDIPLDVAHERNLARERKVPPEIIDAMHKQVQDDPPSEDEGFDSITKVGGAKTATYERPQKLWHVTDRRNRESILQHGLDPDKSDVWGGTDYPHTWAFDHPQKARDLAEALGRSESRKQLDIWEVDSSGLNVVPDPHGKYENSWAIIGPTPSERLSLQSYEGGGHLQKGWDLWNVHYPPEAAGVEKASAREEPIRVEMVCGSSDVDSDHLGYWKGQDDEHWAHPGHEQFEEECKKRGIRTYVEPSLQDGTWFSDAYAYFHGHQVDDFDEALSGSGHPADDITIQGPISPEHEKKVKALAEKHLITLYDERPHTARKQYPAEGLYADLPPLPSPAPGDPGEKSQAFKDWADARRQRRNEFLSGPKLKDYKGGHPYRAPGGCSNCGQQGEWFDASYHAYCPSCRSSWFSRWEEFPAGTKTPEGGDEEEWEAEMGRGPQAEILGK